MKNRRKVFLAFLAPIVILSLVIFIKDKNPNALMCAVVVGVFLLIGIWTVRTDKV